MPSSSDVTPLTKSGGGIVEPLLSGYCTCMLILVAWKRLKQAVNVRCGVVNHNLVAAEVNDDLPRGQQGGRSTWSGLTRRF